MEWNCKKDGKKPSFFASSSKLLEKPAKYLICVQIAYQTGDFVRYITAMGRMCSAV
jgi:hypothetical protein